MLDGLGMAADDTPDAGTSGDRVRETGSRTTTSGVLSDEVLMARIAAGDRAAARALMADNLPRILGMARRMLNDAGEAEDVAQDTFLRVWKAAGRWQAGQARVSSWVTRIAINLCYDRLRKHREVPTDQVPDLADTAPGQEAVLMAGEASARLTEALGRLPVRQRQAIELVHYQDLSNIEAAAIMEVSVDALESLLARGRRGLRALLIGDASDPMASYTGRDASQDGARR